MTETGGAAARALAILRYGLLTLWYAGLRVFLNQTWHQVYGNTTFLVTTKRLADPMAESPFRCVVSRATRQDVDDLFREMQRESRAARYQLLARRWYHERGFGDCYITRTADTGEVCNVRWIVTPAHIRAMGWEDRFPLEDDEVMLENVYTLERFRRQGVQIASVTQSRAIALEMGFRRTRGYADESNVPQLWSLRKQGAWVSARLLERHRLFRVTRTVLERFDPPIAVPVPGGDSVGPPPGGTG